MHDISADILALSSEAAILSRHGLVSFANPPACQILGDDCKGKNLKELFGPDVAETQASSFIIDQPFGSSHYAVRVNRFEDGKIIFLRRCGSSPLLLNDALIFSLRSSLMNFSVSAELLRSRAEESGSPELLASLGSITHSYYQMMRVLTNASTVMSMTEGTLVFAPEQHDIAAFVTALADTVGLLFPQVEISLSCDKLHPIIIDIQLVELLLLNLISNCLTHARGCTRVSINLMETKESLIISVDDNGCGIAPECLGSVFDRYCHGFDMDNMLSGAGLGLTVARSVAHLHGGTLLLESRQGKGTTVRVSLSRRTGSILRSPQESWNTGMQSILTGLASCLPDSCYTEKYMD